LRFGLVWAEEGARVFVCDCPPYDCAGRVKRYLDGDRSAGDELAQKFMPLVLRIVQRVLGPQRREEWEDACQAIFLRIFANLGKWEQRCPFCKWLPVVAGRRAIDFTRLPPPPGPLPAADLPDHRGPAIDRDLIECVERLVATFPQEWQRVWGLWLQGVGREEIASQAGKSLRTIHYWLAEMLEQIRETLDS
jgi:RNA polymerase sigma-70 factor (ECF subfamily)